MIKLKKFLPILIIILVVLAMAGRYLTHGVPHEFITVEYKGTFEGDYDFTLELVDSIKKGFWLPLWSSIYSGPIFVFVANLHVVGQALLYFLTHNQALSVKIYQIIYFILSGAGMYLLADYIYRRRLIGLFCAVLYMFTPFFIGEMLSYLHYSVTYFCFPFAFFLVLKAMDCQDYIYYSLLASLFIALNLLAHPQNVFIAGFFYFLFMLGVVLFQPFRMLTGKDKRSHKIRFYKALKVFLVISAAVFFLSLFFLLPTLIDGYPYTRSLTEGGTWLNPANRIPGEHSRSHSQSFLTSVTLLHWPWFISPLKSFITPLKVKAQEYPPLPFMFIYSLPFLLAVWGILTTRLRLGKRINPRLLLFVFLGLASLNFALGTGLHSFGLFNWAYKFMPFFHMARAPYRYFYQGVLSICLLSGLALYKFPRIKASILFSIVTALYLFAANYYGNHYNWTFIPSEEPRYFSQVQDWLKDNNKEGHRIVETFVTPSYLGNNQRMLPNGLDLLLKNIDKDYLDKYLSLFGIKYILAPRQHSLRHLTFDSQGYMPPRADDGYDDPDDAEEYYAALTTEFYFVYDRLKNDPNFAFYTAGTKDVAIFEDKTAFDNYRLYPTEGLMLLGGVNAYDFLDLEKFDKYFKKDATLRIAPIFIAQSRNLKRISKIKNASKELILHNTDLIDLYLLMNQQRLIFLSQLQNPQWSFFGGSVGWAQPLPSQDHSLGNFVFGDLSFSDSSIFTQEAQSACDIPIRIGRKDSYLILARIYGAEGFSRLSLYFNGNFLGSLEPKSFRGFRWLKIGEGELEPGGYSLRFKTEEEAPALLDSVAVIPFSEFNAGVDNAYKDFNDFPVSFIVNSRNILRLTNSAATDLYIPEAGSYNILLRLLSAAAKEAKGKLAVKTESGVLGSLEYNLPQNRAVNISLNNVNIPQGRHNIIIEGIPADVSLLFIYLSKTQDIPDKAQGPDKPLVLVHTEVNYPGWKMKIGRRIFLPIITNMFLNGFIVDQTGGIRFNIYYSNCAQKIGLVISLSTLILVIFLVFRPVLKRAKGK